MPLIKELSRSARTLIPAALEETAHVENDSPSRLQRLYELTTGDHPRWKQASDLLNA